MNHLPTEITIKIILYSDINTIKTLLNIKHFYNILCDDYTINKIYKYNYCSLKIPESLYIKKLDILKWIYCNENELCISCYNYTVGHCDLICNHICNRCHFDKFPHISHTQAKEQYLIKENEIQDLKYHIKMNVYKKYCKYYLEADIKYKVKDVYETRLKSKKDKTLKITTDIKLRTEKISKLLNKYPDYICKHHLLNHDFIEESIKGYKNNGKNIKLIEMYIQKYIVFSNYIKNIITIDLQSHNIQTLNVHFKKFIDSNLVEADIQSTIQSIYDKQILQNTKKKEITTLIKSNNFNPECMELYITHQYIYNNEFDSSQLYKEFLHHKCRSYLYKIIDSELVKQCIKLNKTYCKHIIDDHLKKKRLYLDYYVCEQPEFINTIVDICKEYIKDSRCTCGNFYSATCSFNKCRRCCDCDNHKTKKK